MENRKISELEERNFSSFDDLPVHVYVPAIINEGSEYVNVKIGLKDLLRLIYGSSGGSGSSSSGGYDSSVIDTMRNDITALLNSVTYLRNSVNYPTHTILVQNPEDPEDSIPYQLKTAPGSTSKTVTIFSTTVGEPKFFVDFFVDRPLTDDNNLIVAGGGNIYSYNGSLIYKGGTIESATVDISYRTTAGTLILAATNVPLVVPTTVLNNTDTTSSSLSLSTTINIGSNTAETIEVVLKINGQTVGSKAIVLVNVNNSVEITGIVL